MIALAALGTISPYHITQVAVTSPSRTYSEPTPSRSFWRWPHSEAPRATNSSGACPVHETGSCCNTPRRLWWSAGIFEDPPMSRMESMEPACPCETKTGKSYSLAPYTVKMQAVGRNFSPDKTCSIHWKRGSIVLWTDASIAPRAIFTSSTSTFPACNSQKKE